MKWIYTSLVFQIILTVYLQAVEWIDLFPWNDLSRGNGQEGLDIFLAVLGLVVIAGTARRVKWIMVMASAFYGVWLALQIQTWWVPYFTGASESWMKVYEVWFTKTYKFLPSIGANPIPDANHTVLTVLILGALISTMVALFRTFPPGSKRKNQ